MDMLTYSGTKTVKARPMTKADYYAFKGNPPPNVDTEGYLVEYQDGYQSWSPKEVFEMHYRPSGTWQERLRIERDELNERVTKLSEFLSSDKTGVGDVDIEALLAQLGVMDSYLAILDIRIDDLDK